MSKKKWHKTETAKYTLYGIIFGLIFPILATSIDILRLGMDFSWKSALTIQNEYPIHYIIDTAPFFLGIFAMFGGINLDRLKQTNLKIQKTSKFKEDFLANMSHEIRTPMVGVIGMIDLLFKNTKLSELQKEYVTTIHQSSLNLLGILNQILDLSKIEAGKLKLTKTNVNYKELIAQNIGLFFATVKSKGISISSEFTNEIPNVIIADSNRLTQVISNLIGNAIKFTKEGFILIKSTLISNEENILTIKIEVIDTGIGIKIKDQKKLFSRFSQFNQESIIAGEGSGLGLTICKNLVSLMGGDLGVKSEFGKGSNFWFTFKTKISKAVIIEKHSPSFNYQKTEKLKLHILLVEDSPTSILVFQQILKYLGCTTDVADNGKKALDMFQEGVYDIILMDINLPELNGIETCSRIRQEYTNVPPIIAITSNALLGDAERYIAKGMDDYITKPFTTEILNLKLKKWCKSK